MKAIRNKLIFKAFQAKEAAREKGLMLKARVLDTTGEEKWRGGKEPRRQALARRSEAEGGLMPVKG